MVAKPSGAFFYVRRYEFTANLSKMYGRLISLYFSAFIQWKNPYKCVKIREQKSPLPAKEQGQTIDKLQYKLQERLFQKIVF